MKINEKSTFLFDTIISLHIIIFVIMVGCEKNPIEPTAQIITMTTTAPLVGSSWSVEFQLFGTGEINISWGDGTSQTIALNGNKIQTSLGYWINIFNYFNHRYSNNPGTSTYNLPRTITITGNVTYLNCSGNRLTSLDVSKNLLLEELCCFNNQLTDLDLCKNSLLNWLDCSENQLSTLNVRNNSKLEVLNCEDNLLINLDVNNNTELEWLCCARNQITNLNLKNNSALEDLYCFRNQLASLDVSGTTVLKLLYCYNNQLTSDALNILFESLHSNNIELGKVFIFSDGFGNTPIGINLSSSTSLKEIYVQGNPGINNCETKIATIKGWRVSTN